MKIRLGILNLLMHTDISASGNVHCWVYSNGEKLFMMLHTFVLTSKSPCVWSK